MVSDLTKINLAGNLRHLAGHMGLIVSLALACIILSPLFILPLGLCLGALFPLMHEATHRHIFHGPRANHRLAFACGAILLMSATWFRHFHQAHHRYTQDPERDPELATPKPSSWRAYIWHLSGIPTWGGSLWVLLQQARGKAAAPFIPARKQEQIIAEARAILALHLTLILLVWWQPVLMLVTYLPLLIGQVFLRAFLLAEHGGLPLVDQVMENTRTTQAAAWLRWLTWNMSFHTEHHANPAIPHDQLPAYHEILRPETCPSYATFHTRYASTLSK